ncbi:PEP-CTERM sorting domain-containing protein [Massilia arenosa]|uniref:PEP-CTERM sorting domain-containing protein n=2 Tax=Zemynaea arenosa TaxID=2561931 RepID=A0A4Y9S5V1_9BURK|nr:PEP-CTERM sorting domain-containing protein [Massilia arenosa]
MVFQFTFTGDGVDLSDPHLKVAFYGTGANKVGSLLSENVPAQPVPEPGEWAMLLAGLGVAGVAARWRRR